MTNPRYSQDGDAARGRLYAIPGYTQEFVSVTNICGIIDKPALIGAAAKRAGERAIQQESVWRAIQQEEGDEAARKFISRASRDYMKYASSLGSAVHYAIECYDGTTTLTDEARSRAAWWWEKDGSKWEPDAEKYVSRVESHLTPFADFLDKTGAEFVCQERTVFHPDYSYAGTLDAVVKIGGKVSVLDFKTGYVSSESVPLQLASYRFATHYVDGDTTRTSAVAIDGGLVLQLKPRSWKLHPVKCDESVFATFLTAKRLWEWRDRGSKSAVGEAL